MSGVVVRVAAQEKRDAVADLGKQHPSQVEVQRRSVPTVGAKVKAAQHAVPDMHLSLGTDKKRSAQLCFCRPSPPPPPPKGTLGVR